MEALEPLARLSALRLRYCIHMQHLTSTCRYSNPHTSGDMRWRRRRKKEKKRSWRRDGKEDRKKRKERESDGVEERWKERNRGMKGREAGGK